LIEHNLHFNYKDIFLAPRLALSPKKIWVFIIGNLSGYISYWLLTYFSIALAGIEINEAIADYGLYPCLYGNSAPLISWIIFYSGIFIWVFFILLSSTAVSKITTRQLKGDNFYSANDALDHVMKKWKTVLFAPLSILFIILSLIILASIFAMIGSIPIIGQLSFPLLYLLYFFGAIFTAFSLVSFMISLIFSPAIIGSYEEDTIGTVFHSFQILFGQPWRIITYHSLLLPLIIIFINILSWFYNIAFNLINQIFGYFMGSDFINIMGYASSIVNNDWISINYSSIKITLEKDLLGSSLTTATDLIEFILSMLIKFFGLFLYALPNFSVDGNSASLSSLETISGVFLSIPLILLTLSIISYGLAILSVGETIIFIIFKKIMENNNVLLKNTEDIIETSAFNNSNLDSTSHSILSNSGYEEE